MTGPPAQFEIHESRASHGLRLSVSGELDVASTAILEDRLTRLRANRSPVRLDLSRLAFIDSIGIYLLVRMFREAQVGHWQLRIEPDVTPEVMKRIKLMHVESILTRGDATAA